MTINDIARICGVSKGTVNRALHGKPGINPGTKEKILAAVRENGFRPDYRAKSLATGKSFTIGLLIPNIENQSFAMIGTIIEAEFWKRGYFLNLALSNDDAEKEESYLELFVDRKVDGVIVFPVNRDPTAVERILEKRIPLVLMMNDLPSVETNVVTIDEYGAFLAMTEYLIGLGHRDIAYIDGYKRYTAKYNDHINRERFRGFTDALAKHGLGFDGNHYAEFLPAYYEQKDSSSISGLFSGPNPATAAMCFHDRIAVWLQVRLIRDGFGVPDDVSVTGFDDMAELSDIVPGITTIRNPFAEIAAKTVEMLVGDIENGTMSANKVRLGTELIIRQSAGVPRSNRR
jgi:LacI family transcriptional regulator